ncbi:hypothetical protein AB0O07_12220 [Streptomyces sp. NPDC093085]|uniref:hypothetical protein n=1 Tax=Streptomyces sp. NPDC093085 TaxID=3155068 RepID=UPI0034352FF0
MTSTERPDKNSADGADRPRGRRSRLAVAAVAAAVLIAGGGGAYFATSAFGTSGADGDAKGGGTGASVPPPLALDLTSAEGAAGAPAAGGSGDTPPPAIAPGEPDPSGVVYHAREKLPSGPETAPVYRTSGTVTAAEVARLAKAFGLTGAPRPDGESWKVGTEKDGSGPLLRVARQAPGNWTFAAFAAAGGDACAKGKSCGAGGAGSASGKASGAPAGGSFAPVDEGDAVSEAAAKKAAAPVLKALGQEDAAVDASRLMGAVRVVDADPVVGGLPTYGWSTAVQVDADGRVTGGYGQLSTPVKGDTYPVIGAAETLKELNKAASGTRSGSGADRIGGCAGPVPLTGGVESARGAMGDVPPALPCAPKSGTPYSPASPASAGSPDSLEIDKAVFGLAVRTVEGRGVLVPSWLFQVAPRDGSVAYTVTHPAVAPKFLTAPAPAPVPSHEEEPGGPGAVGPGAGTEPGSGAGAGDGGGGGLDAKQRATSYEVDGATLTLHFMGGVCDTYKATADESGTAVKVKLVVTNPDPDRFCVAMAKEQSVEVKLEKPLGDREVVDATTGEKLTARA